MRVFWKVINASLYRRALEANRLIKLPSVLGLTALSEAEVAKTTNLVPQSMQEVELNKNFAYVLRRIFSPEFFGSKLIQCLDSSSRSLMSFKLALNRKNVMILMRMLSFYLFRADRETRKMFFRVIRVVMFRGMRNLDEIIFHLLAYKHMQKHYYKIAEICESPR